MFGAVAAVYGYNRIARAVTFLGRRLLRIPIRNYFDDFYAVDSVVTARSGFEAFEELNKALGLETKPSKDVPPSDGGELLGAHVDVSDEPLLALSRSRPKSQMIASEKSMLVSRQRRPRIPSPRRTRDLQLGRARTLVVTSAGKRDGLRSSGFTSGSTRPVNRIASTLR